MSYALLTFALIPLASACMQAPRTGVSSPSISQNGAAAPIDFGEFCGALAGESILTLDARATTLGATIDGDTSGVVADGGSRTLKSLTVADCGDRGPVTIRYTIDQANGLSGFEIFVRDDTTREVVGLAANDLGEEIQEVPVALAFDKFQSKTSNQESQIVTTRMGCFECHVAVSIDYQVVGAEEFWRDVKPVALFSFDASSAETDPFIADIPDPDVAGSKVPSLNTGVNGLSQGGTCVCRTLYRDFRDDGSLATVA